MATTTTARMNVIADEREAEGFYTQAFAIRELAEQRDMLLKNLRVVQAILNQPSITLHTRMKLIDQINIAISQAINL